MVFNYSHLTVQGRLDLRKAGVDVLPVGVILGLGAFLGRKYFLLRKTMHDSWHLEVYIYLWLLSRVGCKYYKKYNAVSVQCMELGWGADL